MRTLVLVAALVCSGCKSDLEILVERCKAGYSAEDIEEIESSGTPGGTRTHDPPLWRRPLCR